MEYPEDTILVVTETTVTVEFEEPAANVAGVRRLPANIEDAEWTEANGTVTF